MSVWWSSTKRKVLTLTVWILYLTHLGSSVYLMGTGSLLLSGKKSSNSRILKHRSKAQDTRHKHTATLKSHTTSSLWAWIAEMQLADFHRGSVLAHFTQQQIYKDSCWVDIHHFILDGWYSHLMGIPSSWDLWRWKWSKFIHVVRHPQAFISALHFSCYSWGTLVSKFCRFSQSLYQCIPLGCDHATRAVSHGSVPWGEMGSQWRTYS